ncbi:MAG: dihydroorotase [Firmicutes bacterium]|nr:dihydroorotase [Candidatus Colimorpha enterica]
MTVFLKDHIPEIDVMEKLPQIETDNIGVFPGLCDVHVHFREPGFSYKETIRTGSLAAARGGYTAVCAMPNLNPVPDSIEHLKAETDIIRATSVIDVYPYGAITVGEKGETLSDLEGMSSDVIAFSDDGHGVQSDEMMERAMTEAKRLGRIVAAHCEVNSLLDGGYIHKGRYCAEHGHRGICSESEWKQIERDISLAKKTGCAYHVCHISCRESVELIRKAKADGVDITSETAPHYLLLDENDLKESGNFKMNPPLRSKEDREALIEGILDGTVDMIATDHAPHSAEEKAKGLQGSPFGIVGLETAFPLLYTYLVKEHVISLDRLLELMCVNPRERFGIPYKGSYTVWDLDKKYVIDPKKFVSKGKSTPFEGFEVFGENLLTVSDGEIKYKLS